MPLSDYARVLGRRWPLLVGSAVLCVTIALALFVVQRPTYHSWVKISLNPARPEFGTALAINNLLSNYSQQLVTMRLLGDISDRLRLDLPAETLASYIKVTPQQDNFLIVLEVIYPDPVVAERIAATLAQTFVDEQNAANAERSRNDRIDLEVLDAPEPARINWPKLEVLVGAGLLGGILLGILMAFILEFAHDTLTTMDEVEHTLGLPLLGAIPSQPRSMHLSGGER